jgi:hypothetical protein
MNTVHCYYHSEDYTSFYPLKLNHGGGGQGFMVNKIEMKILRQLKLK